MTKDYVTRYIKTELKKDDILLKDITPSFIGKAASFCNENGKTCLIRYSKSYCPKSQNEENEAP